MSIIAYKFQSPDGAYWYIRADDQRTLDYWRGKRKLTPLTDDKARIATGVVVEIPDELTLAWQAMLIVAATREGK